MNGTGLGLAIAKWIAEAHHATLSVQSLEEVGSAFTVEFPLPDRPPASPGDNMAAAPERLTGNMVLARCRPRRGNLQLDWLPGLRQSCVSVLSSSSY